MTPAPSSSPAAVQHDAADSFRIRDIVYHGVRRGIVMQAWNGPCPLLALVNVLSLRGQVDLSGTDAITGADLCNLVAEVVLASDTADSDSAATTDTILRAVPGLMRGLNVNVGFDSMLSFEATPEMAVFDRLGVVLVHGWLADPADAPIYDAVAHLTYNELVVRAVRTPRTSSVGVDNGDDASALIRDYLHDTSAQLTPTGLLALRQYVCPDQPCIHEGRRDVDR